MTSANMTRRAQGDVAVPLAEAGGSAADGQLGAVHYGGARARGRAALFLQVMAVAAVSALLTLVAGKVNVRIQFGDRPTLFPHAATPRVVANFSNEGRVAGQVPRKDALHDFAELAEAAIVSASHAFDLQDKERKRKKRAAEKRKLDNEPRRGYTSEYVYNAASTDPKYLSQVWPTVIVLGVQKGGTTSISSLINSHSAVCFNKAGKETHFHSRNGRADAYAERFGTDPSCSRPIQEGDREQAMTKHPILAGKVHLGGRHFEGSVKLFHKPSQVQRFVTSIPKALRPHLKFVIILREPISRDLSAYNHMRRNHSTWWSCPSNVGILKTSNDYNAYLRTFVECWKTLSLPDGVPPSSQAHHVVLSQPEGECSDCSKGVVDVGRYYKHLTRWFKAFDRRQFLILQSDMVYSGAPRELVQDTFRGLGSFLDLAGPEWGNLTADN